MIRINQRAVRLAQYVLEHQEVLGTASHRLECGAWVLDFGIHVPGTWEAAEIFTRLTLGDLGKVNLGTWRLDDQHTFAGVELFISDPQVACLGSQIAGWQLGDGEFATIGSGPARAAAVVEHDPYMKMTSYRDTYVDDGVVLCIQDTRLPGDEVASAVAEACGVGPEKVYLAAAPSASVTGSVQVAARMLEQCCHKMYTHGFSVSRAAFCRGRAPAAPVVFDEVKAMGRINDALLYAAEAEFWLDADDDEIRRLAPCLVSKTSSPCYGTPFGKIFEESGRNFYAIDHEVHSVAVVRLHSLRTGMSFQEGEIHSGVIEESFLA